MQRVMLKSKIHRARVTGLALDYEGSITIDARLLALADIREGEQVQVLNLNTGDRFVTYAIAARPGSGTVVLNGPAARLGAVGDPVIVLAYAGVAEEEARRLKPRIVRVDSRNRPLGSRTRRSER